MRVHVGCGNAPIPGFVNVDPRPDTKNPDGLDVRVGDAAHLPVGDGEASVVFLNAVLEHVFLGQLLPTFAEWERVLAPDGIVVAIGIPDFAAVCYQYLRRGPGVTADTFDLYESYRYTHGWPEGDQVERAWVEWDVSARPDEAPAGWLPQAHKTIMDAELLHDLADRAGLAATVFTYAYQDEPPLNLGMLAARDTPPSLSVLDRIPDHGYWITPDTITIRARRGSSRMAAFAQWATTGEMPASY